MLNERSVSIATEYWATHLGCSPEQLFASPFKIITHADELADYCGAFALSRGGAAIASIPPDRAATLRPLLSPLATDYSPSGFASALASVAAAVIGPAYLGYAASIAPPGHAARALGESDALALDALQQSCASADWEHGGSSLEHPCSGVFVGEQLVAIAGYEVWGGSIAHISIVAHPGFRSHGFGRSAVAHLADRAIRAGLLPQYRTLESNRASICLGESLGFQRYATSMAVQLRHDA